MVKNATKDIGELETFSASKTKVYIGGTRFDSIRKNKNGKKKNEKKNKNANFRTPERPTCVHKHHILM